MAILAAWVVICIVARGWIHIFVASIAFAIRLSCWAIVTVVITTAIVCALAVRLGLSVAVSTIVMGIVAPRLMVVIAEIL